MIASAMRTTSGERTVKHTVSCDAGYRVYSVTTNDGHWLDAMTILCTGGGDALQIPDPDSDGGVEGGGPDPVLWANCGNTTGLQAMVFTRPIESFCKGGSEDGPVINLNVTCMNNETYSFANDK